MFSPQLLSGIMDKLRPGWRARAASRRSLWHLIKIPGFFVLLIVSYQISKLAWYVNTLIYPEHAGIRFLSPEFLSLTSLDLHLMKHIGFMVLLFSPSMLAIFLTFMVANLVLWCIIPARNAFEEEARKVGDVDMTFKKSMHDFLKYLKYIFPVTMVFLAAGILMIN